MYRYKFTGKYTTSIFPYTDEPKHYNQLPNKIIVLYVLSKQSFEFQIEEMVGKFLKIKGMRQKSLWAWVSILCVLQKQRSSCTVFQRGIKFMKIPWNIPPLVFYHRLLLWFEIILHLPLIIFLLLLYTQVYICQPIPLSFFVVINIQQASFKIHIDCPRILAV